MPAGPTAPPPSRRASSSSSRRASGSSPARSRRLSAGWIAATLPFYPAGWPLALGAVAGVAGARGAARSASRSRSRTRSSRSRTSRSGSRSLYAALAARVARADVARPAHRAPRRRGTAARAARRARLRPARRRRPFAGDSGAPRRPAPRSCSSAVVAGLTGGAAAVRANGAPPPDLGVAGSDRPGAVAHALWAAARRAPGAARRSRGRRRSPPLRCRSSAAAAPGRPRSSAPPLLGATALVAPAAAYLPLVAGSVGHAPRCWRVEPDGLDWLAGEEPGAMSVLRNIESEARVPLRGRLRPRVPDATCSRSSWRASSSRRWTTTAASPSRASTSRTSTRSTSRRSDREQFAAYEESLRDELQEYLVEHARREGYALLSPPRVRLETDADLDRRRVRDRDADGADRAARRGRARQDDEPGATMVYKPVQRRDRGGGRRRSSASSGRSRSCGGTGERREVTQRRVVIGRSKDCDVQVTDPNVSRRHAEVRQEGATYWLVDLDSTNGVEIARQARQAAQARGRDARSRSARPRSGFDREPVGGGMPRSRSAQVETTLLVAEARVPRAPLPLHLADRPLRGARPAAAAGVDDHRSAAGGRRRARTARAEPAERGRLVVVESPALDPGDAYRARLGGGHRRARGEQRRPDRRRRVRVGAPRAVRAAARRRLRRGRRLDERHLRQRHPPHARAPARARRRRPRRRDRPKVRGDERSARSTAADGHRPQAAAQRGLLRLRSRRCSRSPTGWAARRPARSRRRSPPTRSRSRRPTAAARRASSS